MTLCENCKVTLPTLKNRLSKLNYELWRMGLTFHKLLPVQAIDTALERYGFKPTSFTWLGQDTRVHEEVGEGKWLSANFHLMESGNWEVVAYVN